MKLTTAIPVSAEVKEDIRKRIQAIERYQEQHPCSWKKKLMIRLLVDLLFRWMMNYLMRVSGTTFVFIKKQFVENMYIQQIR